MEFQVIKITAAMKFLAREAVEARLGMIERALTLFNLGHRMSASSFSECRRSWHCHIPPNFLELLEKRRPRPSRRRRPYSQGIHTQSRRRSGRSGLAAGL